MAKRRLNLTAALAILKEVILPRMESDLLDMITDLREGKLKPTMSDDVGVTVIMATNGYPGSYEKGSIIKGLDEL